MKKLLLTAFITFLAAAIIPVQQPLEAENLLSPPSRVNSNYPDIPFEMKCRAYFMTRQIYELDVLRRLSKEEIAERCGGLFLADRGIKFNIRKSWSKGYTGCYPFSVGENHFIAMVFLEKEAHFRDEERRRSNMPVLFEVVTPGMRFWVLPGINDILKECPITPYKPPAPSPSDTGV